MFLHIGGDVIILKKDIIAIFSNESTLKDTSSKEYLEIVRNEGKIKAICDKNKAKSFIITNNYVYISPISSNTLLKRSDNITHMVSN